MKPTMKRMCVFCGKPPDAKNREHVLPQWLIALTGAPNRIVMFGTDRNTNKPRAFSYNSFTFPACEACNNLFAVLESECKPILLRLLASENLSQSEFHILLDWFDKVRTGLWLAFYFLDKNIGGIVPQFHIRTRIGMHDRVLHLIKVSGNGDELSFRGCDMPAFYYTPSCFSMIINNYCFVNISSPFLFSRSVGFPFPSSSYLLPGGLADYEMVEGSCMLGHSLMPGWFEYEGTIIAQPMFQWQARIPQFRYLYDNDYIKRNCLSYKHGVGNVFVEKGDGLKAIPSSDRYDWMPRRVYDRQALNPGISIHTIQLQLRVDTLSPSRERLGEAERLWWQDMLRSNQDYANRITDIMRENAGISAV